MSTKRSFKLNNKNYFRRISINKFKKSFGNYWHSHLVNSFLWSMKKMTIWDHRKKNWILPITITIHVLTRFFLVSNRWTNQLRISKQKHSKASREKPIFPHHHLFSLKILHKRVRLQMEMRQNVIFNPIILNKISEKVDYQCHQRQRSLINMT